MTGMSTLASLTPNPAPVYTVRLELFEGPMDLLLKLIERQELDITRLSLAAVTDQYVDHLRLIEEQRPDEIADFLLLAARLLLIKSRILLPKPPALEEPEEDLGDQLARQLIEYRKFKQVAQLLRQKSESGLRAHPRLAAPPKMPPRVDLEGLSLEDLVQCLREALRAHPPVVPVNHLVAPLTMRVGDKIDRILQLTRRRKKFSFQRFLATSSSRMDIIVSFLAVLELIKRRQITVRQDRLFGEIVISARPDAAPPGMKSQSA